MRVVREKKGTGEQRLSINQLRWVAPQRPAPPSSSKSAGRRAFIQAAMTRPMTKEAASTISKMKLALDDPTTRSKLDSAKMTSANMATAARAGAIVVDHSDSS